MVLEAPGLQDSLYLQNILHMIWIFCPEWKKWIKMQIWLCFSEELMILDMEMVPLAR